MLILASSSKARRDLLIKAGIEHKVIVSDVDEEKFEKNDIISLVELLAEAKANNVVSKVFTSPLEENSIKIISAVLGCDSLFEFEGEIYGKPRNKKEAICRWEKMSSRIGYLHTGHCLRFRENSWNQTTKSIDFSSQVKVVVTTKIRFSEMNIDEIVKYVETGEPMKCAGGFALDGIGGMFIKEIEGCYSNVLGLSLPWLRYVLKKFDLLNNLI